MEQVIVSRVDGDAFFIEQASGELHPLRAGAVLSQGDLLMTSANAEVVLVQSDQPPLLIGPNQHLPIALPESQRPLTLAELMATELTVEQVQQALLAGNDPSNIIAPPAAIELLLASAHNSGLSVGRDGKSTLAQAGHDTRYGRTEPNNDERDGADPAGASASTASIKPLQFQLVEGNRSQGNLNADTGAKGAGYDQLITVAGKPLVEWPLVTDGEFIGARLVDLPTGELFIYPDGSYFFVAFDSSDHTLNDALQQTPIELQFQDGFGSIATTTLIITVNDGVDPQGDSIVLSVDDDGEQHSEQTLLIQQGADPLDLNSFGFDVAALLQQLQALPLSSAGVALDLDNIESVGNVITLFDLQGNPLLSLSIVQQAIVNGGDLAITIALDLHAPLDHPNGSDAIDFNVVISGTDIDGDPVSATVAMTLLDAMPEAADVSAAVIEAEGGNSVSGNLLANTNFSADGAAAAGGVTVVSGVVLAEQTPLASGAYAGFIEVAVDNGTLYVKTDGSYLFVADDNLDHGSVDTDINFDVPFTVEDFDGDESSANLNLTIVDGAAPTAETVAATVSDSGSSARSEDLVELRIERGSDELDVASFEFDTGAISAAIAALNLTSGGVAVDGSNFTLVGSILTILDANGAPVLELVLGSPTDDGGDLVFPVIVTSLAPLDHDGDRLTLPTFIAGQDTDNDPVQAQIDITVTDTAPIAADVSASVVEAEGGNSVSGNLLANTNFSADGAAAAGGVTVVNGVVLAEQTPISSGTYAGYIEVAVDNGTLYVKTDGSYLFVADDNLDHGSVDTDITFDVPFIVEDFDGDESSANLNLTIVDGEAPTAATVAATVSDSGSSARSEDLVELRIERGSDELDAASFEFDTGAISAAIAALNLTSGAVAVDGSNFTLVGSTLTILDANGTPVLELVLGSPTDDGGDLLFPITITSLAPLDHEGDSLTLPIFIAGQDSDNDPVQAQIDITVTDTAPEAADVSASVVEAEGGNSVSGNLLSDGVLATNFSADGAAAAGGVTVVNGLVLAEQTPLVSGPYAGYIEVAVDNGTLYVKTDGSYLFVADDNLDHGSVDTDITFDVPFTVEDFDGDESSANLNLTIVDGAAPTAATVAAIVSDSGSSAHSEDLVELRIERGSDELDAASFEFDTGAISAAIAALNLTSGGVAVDGSNFTLVGSTLTILDASGTPVLELVLGSPADDNGDLLFPITVNSLAPLDHDGDSLTLPIFIAGQDTDNDPVQAQIDITVTDTAPIAADVSASVIEAEGGNSVSGNLLSDGVLATNFSADGAAAAGGVTVVNGLVLAEQTPLVSGPYAGYIEVAVDNGTLYVKTDGSYVFVADDNLDHGSVDTDINFDVPFTVEDFDGDESSANLNLTIVDGAAPTAATVAAIVSDSGSSAHSEDLVELRIERGSDELDVASFEFDIGAISAAIAALNLTSGGVAVDGSNFTLVGSTLTILDASGTPALELVLGSPTDDGGDLVFPVTVTSLAPLDHDGDSLTLPIFIAGQDSDNDPVQAQIDITVTDTAPEAADVSASVVEAEGGNSVSGNLLANTNFSADGAATAGGVTVVNGVVLSEQTPLVSGPYAGYIEVAVDNGTLYVKTDGSYLFVADENLDHGSVDTDINFDVPFTVEDFDGDESSANLNLTIVDGAAPTAATVAATVSDSGSSARSEDLVELRIERGSDELDAASFEFDTGAITSAIAALGLTSGGVAVDGSNFILIGSTLTILDANGTPVLELVLGSPTDDGGDLVFPVIVTSLAPLDHDGDSLTLPIFIAGQDRDNDPVQAQIDITVTDTAPVAADVSASVIEAEGGNSVSGNLLSDGVLATNFSADGAAAAGSVTVVNGVVLAEQTPLVSGPYAGYIEVAVDNGTLYVKTDGSYLFVADDNLDHGSVDTDITFDVPFTVEDFDGDSSGANLNLTIVDGDGPTVAAASVSVDEADSGAQVALRFERGSDQLDASSVEFDTAAISAAIAALGLTSGGVAVDGSNFSLNGNVLTINDANGNGVLQLTLGTVVDDNGDLLVPITVQSLAPQDHSAAIELPIFVTAGDTDNDQTQGQITVTINDDGVVAEDVSNSVTEGQSVGGNLLTDGSLGTDFGADGSGGVTVVNGVVLAEQTPISSGTYAGYIEVALDNGTLYVKTDGSYLFVADDNLNHSGGDIRFEVPFTVEDSDGSSDDATLSLTVSDGADPTAAIATANVSDDVSSASSNDQLELRIERGSDELDVASFEFDTAAITSAIAALGLTSGAVAVDGSNFILVGSTLTILDGNDNPVLEIILGDPADDNGDLLFPITVNPLAPLDHNGDSLTVPIFIAGQDSDGDGVQAQVDVIIADVAPEAADVSNSVIEQEAGGIVAGDLLAATDFGSDGAGQVVEVAGLVLAEQTPLASGPFAGYIEIVLDNGVLYVKPDGSYQFDSADDLDHGDPETDISFSVPFTVEDSDGSRDDANLNLTIVDGTAPTAEVVAAQLDDGSDSTSVELRFERGSDGIDRSTIEFDVAAISSALATLGLSSAGVPLDFANLVVSGNTLTINDSNGNPVIQLELGTATKPSGDLLQPITITLLQPLDHRGNAAIELPIFVTAGDTDNDQTQGQISVTINDDGVVAEDVSNSVTEGQSVSGNLLTDGTAATDFGADGAAASGGVTVVNGVILAEQTPLTSGAYAGYIEVAVDNGTLYVKADGSYVFVADDNLNHSGGDIRFEVPFTVEDSDGSSDDATLSLTVSDGADPTAAIATANVSDDGSNASSNDQLELRIERGSDELDVVSFEFDTAAITRAIAALGLTSGAVAVDGSNFILVGSTLTILDSNNNPVLELILGDPADDNGDLLFPITVNPLAPLDHDGDSLTVPIFIAGQDSDGDGVQAQINVLVADTGVAAADVSNSVVEAEGGSSVSGNLLTDGVLATNFSADGAAAAGGVTVVNGVVLAEQTPLSSGAYAGYIEVAVDNGTLYVKADGSYVFVADDNLEHGSIDTDINFDVPFTVEDFDGDESSANLNLTIVDGEAPTAATVAATVSDSGSSDQVELRIERGSDQLEPSSFEFDTDAISTAIAALNLTSGGVAVDGSNFTLVGSTLTILDANGAPVLELVLGSPADDNGDLLFPITITSLAPLDHDGDRLTLPVFIAGQDSDNDPVQAQIDITVTDTAPVVADVSASVVEAEGGNSVSGNLLNDGVLATNFSADGAAAAGGVTVVNGVVLAEQTPLTSGAYAGYIEVAVDNGTLYVKTDGSYLFVADDNLDHGSPEADLNFDVPFTVEDFDGDESSANLNLTIVDGSGPTLSGLNLAVDESGGSSDSGTVSLNRGSDQLDLSKLGFDVAATIAALDSAGLAAVSGAIDADATSVSGGVMTLYDIHGTAVMTITLGLPSVDSNGDATVPVSVNLLQPFDHDDDSLTVPVVLQAGDSDSDNDIGNATINIEVTDGEPLVPVTAVATVVEGQSSTDVDLLANAELGMDEGVITAVNGVALSASNFISDISDPHFGYHGIDTQYGTVYIKADGSYHFDADPDLDHGSAELLRETIAVTVTDGDGDPVTVNLSQAISDGAAPTSTGIAGSVMVSETTGLTDTSQTLRFERGSDPIAAVKLDPVATAAAIVALFGGAIPTSNGSELDLDNMTLSADGSQLVISNLLGEAVLQIDLSSVSVDGDGHWDLTLTTTSLQGLDHISSDAINLPVVITATDQDNDSVSQQAQVVVLDSSPVPSDDSDIIIEGEISSGNLLSNDQLGTDGALINAIRIDGAVLDPAQAGVLEFAVGASPLVLQTISGELTIAADGSWSLNTHDNQSHPGDVAIDIPFQYQLTDNDGDASEWADVDLSVVDGAVRLGGESASQTVTEKDLANNAGSSTYPRTVTTNLAIENSGSDQLDHSTFGIDMDLANLAAELQAEITSSGNSVTATVTATSISLVDNVTGEVVLSINYSISDVAGVPTVQVTTVLSAPLDHIKANDSSNGAVTISGSNIAIDVPLQLEDGDGDPLQQPIAITTNIKDGSKPAISLTERAELDESDLSAGVSSISDTGTVLIKVNSDQLNTDSLRFKTNGHTTLYSNGEKVVYSLDPADPSGRTLLGKVGDTLVLSVEMTTPLAADGNTAVSYTVTQYQPLDQGSSQTANFKIKVSDVDGDTRGGTIKADFSDGDGSNLSLSSNSHQLSEHDIGDDAQQINADNSGELGNSGTLTLTTDTDAVSNLYFDFSEGQVLSGVSHDGQPVQLFQVDGVWQAWSMDGASQDTLIFTLESPMALDDGFEVAANSTAQVPYQINWHSFIDQPPGSNSVSINLPVVAVDADGDSSRANITLTVLDGADPSASAGVDPAAVTEVNGGGSVDISGAVLPSQGSDFIRYEVDTAALQTSLDGLSSDNKPLTVALVNGEYLVTRPDGNGGTETVMIITFNGRGGYNIELLDNLDHDGAGNDASLSFGLPIRLVDSDGDSTTVTPQITINDTVAISADDSLSLDEGDSVSINAAQGLLSNDDLGSDADGAQITTIRYDGIEHPLIGGTVTITTDLGNLTVNSDGSWSFSASAGLDHGGGSTLVDQFDYLLEDGDGDADWGNASIRVDDDSVQLTANGGQGVEDAASIALSVAIYLGDVDQNDLVGDVLIDAPDPAAGTLYLNGVALTINSDGQVLIPSSALNTSVSADGSTLSVNGLTFVPVADYADNSAGGPLTLGVSVAVTNDIDGTVTLTDNLTISVLAEADEITWFDRDLQINEDPGGDGELLFQSAANPDGIAAGGNDDDGSEVLSYRIDSIPDGFSLFLDGELVLAGTELTEAQTLRVTVKADEHDAGQYTIGITAISTEQGSGDQINVQTREHSADITVDVVPVVDTPTLSFAVAGAGGNERTIKSDEDQLISFGQYLNFSSPDSNEITYLRVEELTSDGDKGLICMKQGDTYVSLSDLVATGQPLPDGIHWDGSGFIIRADVLDDIGYQPDEDRNSANFDDVRLAFTVISEEISQDGIDPLDGFSTATSAETLYLNFDIQGVADQTELTDGDGYRNQLDEDGQPTGTFLSDTDEDQPLSINLNLSSGDGDGSEVLNFLLRQIPPDFVIADSSGNPPPIAGFETIEYNGVTVTVPIYQITAAQMEAGTYQITPPADFGGDVALLLTSLVTETDGDAQEFDNPLIWTITPTVDSSDTSVNVSGREVVLDDDGDYLSGGISVVKSNRWLGDRDGSERIDDVAISVPDGFAIWYNGALYTEIASVAALIGGDSSDVNALLDSGGLVVVPVLDDGGSLVIDTDAPTPSDGASILLLTLMITDEQNGHSSDSAVAVDVSLTMNWSGEVDGESLSGDDSNSEENTGLVSPADTVVNVGGLLQLGDLISFVSTDVDGSEQVEKYRIELPDGDNWSLQDADGNPIGVHAGDGVWLLAQSDLAGVVLQGHSDGSFDITVTALISDQGDLEARQTTFTAELSDTVAQNSGSSGDGVVGAILGELFLTPVDGAEDGVDADGNPQPAGWLGHVDVSAHGDGNDVVNYRIDIADLPAGASLSGNVTEIWGSGGELLGYVINQSDLNSVAIDLAAHQSGEFAIPITVVITDPLSGDTYHDAEGNLPVATLNLQIAAVADGVTIGVNGQGIETEDVADADRFNLGLTLNQHDNDGSETITQVLLTPQAGLTLFGDGLQLTDAGYLLERGADETDAEFQARIDSIQFHSEAGLTHNLDIGVQVTTIDENSLGSDTITQQADLSVFVAPINNGVVLSVADASTSEDNEFVLTGLAAVLTDSAETMSLLLEGVPAGSFLWINGTAVPHNGDGVWQIPVAWLNADGSVPDITVRPPDDVSGEFTLTLRAISRDDEVSEFAEDSASFTVTINPAADDIALLADSAVSGAEGELIDIGFDLQTSDLASSDSDSAEAVLLTFSLDPSSDPSLSGGDGTPPSVIVDGVEYPLVLQEGIWQVQVEVAGSADNQLLEGIVFNSGDGFGSGRLNVSAEAIDRTTGLPSDSGDPISTSIDVSITPTADLPQLIVPTNLVSDGSAIALAIAVSVVNPAAGEVTVVISGIDSGQLQDAAGNPLGIVLANGDVQLDATELAGLQWVGAADGSHNLGVTATSAIDGAGASSSGMITVDVDASDGGAAGIGVMDAGLMFDSEDDLDSTVMSERPTTAVDTSGFELQTIDLGELFQHPDEEQTLENLLQNAELSVGEADENGLVDIVVALPTGEDSLVLNDVDIKEWEVSVDDPDGFMDKFVEEFNQRLQNGE
ncbi:retention module-containing protein [uncultured Ferrimonas sp.]|uniref:retention module-containing protein n=1 Tax=uncultured Ferrimonas sp. TaxID=432640 RepID=UPI002622098B|nr:retention module-containing protein [uncultured Ferrimonas sp.]